MSLAVACPLDSFFMDKYNQPFSLVIRIRLVRPKIRYSKLLGLKIREFDVRKWTKSYRSESFLCLYNWHIKAFTPMTDTSLIEISCVFDGYCEIFTLYWKTSDFRTKETLHDFVYIY